ncbi:unnamed protein product [Albugo candida]|uniref:Glutamyl-tRNA(Gln) amidotransferase subunit B, mitochondrial n=2 Tax=Albugo candida TaxID=65357 RepID=A0A024GRX8_9STRA|nr:unnamed protein product [Albugo candida]|eukprot:CCI49321.1 unnamed protein product [Albugo candida]
MLSNGSLIRSSTTGRLWQVCIGLEVHAQILSNTKLMSESSSPSYAAKHSVSLPNQHVSFYDAALPGTLPLVNKACVHQAIRASLAFNATIHRRSIFERKHYFYCDLPLGYQVTQQRNPIASSGSLSFEIPNSKISDLAGSDIIPRIFDASKYKSRKEKNEALNLWKAQKEEQRKVEKKAVFRKVRIARIQLEQDSGKCIHDIDEKHTLVDLNRAGTGLLEIVFQPDLQSPAEIGYLVQHLQRILRCINVSDGNMEDGSLRCDLNVSVRPVGVEESIDCNTHTNPELLGQRVEIKNMNSIRNMIRAAEFEAKRQIAWIEETSSPVAAETRSFDSISGITKKSRSKETEKDYRFMPEPDLLPLILDEDALSHIKNTMPELPEALIARLIDQYGLTAYDSSVLVNEPGAVSYFERVVSKKDRSPKSAAAWILNELFNHLKTTNTEIAESPVSSCQLGQLLDLIQDGSISGKIAKQVLEIMYFHENTKQERENAMPLDIVNTNGWRQINDTEKIREICRRIVNDPKHEKSRIAYCKGKRQIFGFFVGQVMKECDGLVNPEKASEAVRELLHATEDK